MDVMIDQSVAKLSSPAAGARAPAAKAPSQTKKKSMTEAVMLSSH
jgi:hypothetical protein